MNKNFEILDYNDKNLEEALSFKINNVKLKTLKEISKSYHFKYFKRYFSNIDDGLKAKSILIEYNYFSQSYFKDYINYYANCYRNHVTFCQRIHFFSQKLTNEEFLQALSDDENKIWKCYLGYIVVKPIPKGIIGATLLKQYKEDHSKNPNAKRFYPAKKEFQVNIFGKEMSIETMPYQEQDSIVGSCATAALWFCFHQLNEVFKTPTLTPSEITIKAGQTSESRQPIFPSEGLTVQQILNAIYNNGLIADTYMDIKDKQFIKFLISAYLRLRIPILMGIGIDQDFHLVTVNGCRIDYSTKIDSQTGTNFNLKSDYIDRVFVHDDQVGPFASVKFEGEGNKIKTSWYKTDDDDYTDTKPGEINLLIVPLIETFKVNARVFYAYEVRKILALINDIFEERFILDAFLIKSNEYKKDLRRQFGKKRNYPIQKLEVLFESLPKYIWVIQCLGSCDNNGGEILFDIIYDPYDLNFQGRPIFSNIYDKDLNEFLMAYKEVPVVKALVDYFDQTIQTRDINDFKEFI